MKVLLAAALLMTSFVAGCTSSSDDALGDSDADDLSLEAAPVVYLNLTIGDETHRFSTDKAAAGSGNVTGSPSATTTVASSNSTATGNATGGNSTAGGNATAGNSTEDTGPGGEAPLNVSATLGAKGLPAGQAVEWTIDFGDAAEAAGNATGNASAGNSTAGNGTSSKAAGPSNGTTLPATVEHTYTEAGTYNVSLTFKVANGTPQVLRASLTVTGPAGNMTNTTAGPVPEPIVIEGSVFGNAATPVVVGSTDETFDLVGTATTMTVTMEYSGPSGQDDLDWEIAGPGGESHSGANGGQEDPATFEAPSEGTWTVTIVPWLAVGPVDYTITVTFT